MDLEVQCPVMFHMEVVDKEFTDPFSLKSSFAQDT